MPIYYVTARPETVVSLVKTGLLPDKLPFYIRTKEIICYRKNILCAQTSGTTYHQTFILEIDIPTSIYSVLFVPDDTEKNDDTSLILYPIKPDWIQKIIVYSQQGQKLIARLFKNECPKRVELNPDVYSNLKSTINISQQTVTQKLQSNDDRKRKRDYHENHRRTQSNKSLIDQNNMPSSPSSKQLYRLSTINEHIEQLKSAFNEAKRSILMTSYEINNQTLREVGLYQLIPRARQRGVKIYFYWNDQKNIDGSVWRFLDQQGVSCSETFTHSKILAVDNVLVALGSFNWLSIKNDHSNSGAEGSIVCRGVVCEQIISDLWKHLKNYRNYQFENFKNIERFENNPFHHCAIEYDLDGDSTLTYFPTLELHRDFIRNIFHVAKRRIIICSPFISSTGDFRCDIDHQLLQEASGRGVEVFFICSAQDPYIDELQQFLEQLNVTNIHLISINNFHLKTVIIDDQEISEGSFNWLSAARDRASQYHNHEATFFVSGSKAKDLIDHFFQFEIGQAILMRHFNQPKLILAPKSASIPKNSSKARFNDTKKRSNPIYRNRHYYSDDENSSEVDTIGYDNYYYNARFNANKFRFGYSNKQAREDDNNSDNIDEIEMSSDDSEDECYEFRIGYR